MSVPHSNSMVTTLMPMPVFDRTRRTPPAPFIAVSIGKVTRRSTSSGGMPWASATTVTEGAVRSGKTSIGERRAAQVPQASRNTAAASTSRRLFSDAFMIRSIMVMPPDSVRVAVADLGTAGSRQTNQIGLLRYHALTGLHTVAHLDVVTIDDAQFDGSSHERLPAGLHVDHVATGVFDDGRTRYRQAEFRIGDKDVHRDARPDQFRTASRWVVEGHSNGPGHRVHRCLGLDHPRITGLIEHDRLVITPAQPGTRDLPCRCSKTLREADFEPAPIRRGHSKD